MPIFVALNILTALPIWSCMNTFSKLFGVSSRAAPPESPRGHQPDSISDGAIDTLSSVMRIMGDESFPLDEENDANAFADSCAEFARHIENGAGVPSFDIHPTDDGSRSWGRVRRFFADRRHAENRFVTERLGDYRDVVEDLVGGLRNIVQRDQQTEGTISHSLEKIKAAVETGDISRIKTSLATTVQQVEETFSEQRREYEQRLEELNERMSCLRKDLVDAREEMQRDSLTNAYNRRAFDTAIRRSLSMQLVLRQPVVLMMIDLDNFKQINDGFGHAAGDDALRKLGDTLARNFIRKHDIVARYGGDEFAVILPDTSAVHARKLIDRLIEQAAEIRIDAAPDEALVTCSVGYTEVCDEDTVALLVERADKALYEAKSSGRNRAAYIAPDS